jgi:ATP-dependent DNA helicase RecQ
LSIENHQLKERLREIHQKGFVDYLDGNSNTIRFLKPREDRTFSGKWWSLFEQIQKNKLQKWEEMKFFTRNNKVCKMKLILLYFGEKNAKNCGNCYVCSAKKTFINPVSIEKQILEVLEKKPSTIDDLSIVLHFHEREKLQENLIFLLDIGKIKMFDFRTYMIK